MRFFLRNALIVSLALSTACNNVNATLSQATLRAPTTFTVSVGVNTQTAQSVTGLTVKSIPRDPAQPTLTTSGPCSDAGCSLQAQSALGYVTADIALTSQGTQVLHGSLRLDVHHNNVTQASVVFGGAPVRVLMSSEPAYVMSGTVSTIKLVMLAKDAQDRRIIGDVPYPSPVPFTVSDPSNLVTMSAQQFTRPSEEFDVAYDGGLGKFPRFTSSLGSSVEIVVNRNGYLSPSGNAIGSLATSAERVDSVPTAPAMPLRPLLGSLRRNQDLTHVDLSSGFGPIGNQGNEESCQSFASEYGIMTYLQAMLHKWTLTGSVQPFNINGDHVFSPLFTYLEFNGGQNVGLDALDVVEFAVQKGGEPWNAMPWSLSVPSPPPSPAQIADAQQYELSDYYTINVNSMNAIATMKNYLAGGIPLFWDVNVDQNFPKTRTWRPEAF